MFGFTGSYRLDDYLPIDPTQHLQQQAEAQTEPPPPPPAAAPQTSSAPSTSAQSASRSQSNDSHPANVDPTRVTTAEYRRDLAQAAPYVPTPIKESAAAGSAPPPQPTPQSTQPQSTQQPPTQPQPVKQPPTQQPPKQPQPTQLRVKSEPNAPAPAAPAAPAPPTRPPETAARNPQQPVRANNQQAVVRERRQMEIANLHANRTERGQIQQQAPNPAPQQASQQELDHRQRQFQQQQHQIQNQQLHMRHMMQVHGGPGMVHPGNNPQQQRPQHFLISPEEARHPERVLQCLEFPTARNPMPPNSVKFKGVFMSTETVMQALFQRAIHVPQQLYRCLPAHHPLHPDNPRPPGAGPNVPPVQGVPIPADHLRRMQMMGNQQMNMPNHPGNQQQAGRVPPQQAGRPNQNNMNSNVVAAQLARNMNQVPQRMAAGALSQAMNLPPGIIRPPNMSNEQFQAIIAQGQNRILQAYQRVPPFPPNQGPQPGPNPQMMPNQMMGPQRFMHPPPYMPPVTSPQHRPPQQQPGPPGAPQVYRPLTHAQQMMERSQRNPEVPVNPINGPPPVSSFTPAPQAVSETIDVKPVISTPKASANKNQKPVVITIRDEPQPPPQQRVQVKREVPDVPDERVSSSGDVPSTSEVPPRTVRVKQEPIDHDAAYAPRPSSDVEREIIIRQTEAKCEKKKQREIAEILKNREEEMRRNMESEMSRLIKQQVQEELKKLTSHLPNPGVVAGPSTSAEPATPVVAAPETPVFDAPEVVQESRVTTSQHTQSPRSRSSSIGSELVVEKKKKKKVVIEDSDSGGEPDKVAKKESSRPPSRSSTSRPRKKPRKRIVEDSDDDDMPPMLSRKRNRRMDSDEEYQMEAEDQGESEMEDFINDGELEDEDNEEDSMKDFIVDEEGPSRKKSSRSVARETPKRTNRSRVHKSPEPSSSSKKPKTYEEIEAAKKARRVKTMKTREENRLKKQQANLEAMSNTGLERVPGRGMRAIRPSYDIEPKTPTTEDLTQTIRKFHKSNDKKDVQKPQPLDHRRRTDDAAGNKRPSTSTRDSSDSDGVHIPAKRMAHSSSVPKPSSSRKEGVSAVELSRKRPNQSSVFEKRQSEADDAKIRMEEEYKKLMAKKYPTEQEQLRIRELKKKLSVAVRSGAPATSSSSSTANIRKVTVKREIPSTPEKKSPPPKLLKPHLGASFASARKYGIEQIFTSLIGADVPNAEAEAQKRELEVAEKARNGQHYRQTLVHKIAQIRREATSGVIVVNKNAVSHQQILAGGAKENCTVGTNRRQQFRPEQLAIESLHPMLIPLKLTQSELQKNAYPLFLNGSKTAEIAETTYTVNKKMFLEDHDLTRTCSRCNKEFRLNSNGTMIHQKDICRYHNRGIVRDGKKQTFSKRYPCCNEEFNTAPGCKFSDVHVFDQLFKKELKQFVATPKPSSPSDPRSVKAYALDCEFVYTVNGPALARLTMVDMKNVKVLDVFVKPPSEVLDPNTEFSGLTMEQVQNATDTMKTCHEKLFKMVNSETILIGHSLESDLKAMRIVHMSVIDTAILFSKGDYKTALRTLSSKFLHKNIQGDVEDALGHDSLEDAQACVDLIFYGLRNPESLGVRPDS